MDRPEWTTFSSFELLIREPAPRLLDVGADVAIRNAIQRFTALHISAQEGPEGVVRMLLGVGGVRGWVHPYQVNPTPTGVPRSLETTTPRGPP